MLMIRGSKSVKANTELKVAARKAGQDNVKWLQAQLPKENDGMLRLLLVGGAEPLHFRLRVAQSHFRHDMSPSHFSHVALLSIGARGRVKLWESALDSTNGFGYPPNDNGFRFGSLKDYADPRKFPNVCLLTSGVAQEEVLATERIRAFRHQRAALDVVALVHAWLGYVWGVGEVRNPLQHEQGIPSAAAAEVLLANSGLDLTPGVSARASCPEAIWQAAKWWQLPANVDADLRKNALSGAFHIEHVLGRPPRRAES